MLVATRGGDRTLLGRWWWSVDRWTLIAMIMLAAVGMILTMAAGPSAAQRIGLSPMHFVQHQFLFLAPALIVMFAVSTLSPKNVRRLGVLGFGLGFILLISTLFFGNDVKGASRWITLGGLTIQPSEFVKPCLSIIAAWLLALAREKPEVPGRLIAALLYIGVCGLLVLQPDFGMTMVVAVIGFVQFFLAGLPLIWVLLTIALLLGVAFGAYTLLPHVAARIDRYLDPSTGDTYQVDVSLRALQNGGLLGRGPGEGSVKSLLPDSHTDFVFAVAGEEFGLLACMGIVALFGFIVLRGFSRALKDSSLFVVLAVAGLLTQFGLQALVNIGVTLQLLPAKGMTLPFISYGGSSMIATALGLGMVLALTRARPHEWRPTP
ncbi:MAG: cell division protein FtsW [Alphaproteobacteria bacterium]|nr:cell division protein FtsW [Alphaproteobacteria bacterium]